MSVLTPNMSIPVSVVGVDSGLTWEQNINAAWPIIDGHTHNPGSGVPITPGGININADLTWNNLYNAVNLRSVRFASQAAALALSTDKGCLYEAGVDLYYNDGSGNQIRITQSGTVAGSTGTITGLPSGTASAAYSAGSGTFVFQQATSTAANLDVASIAIRYPGSYPTPSGNYIQIQAPSSLASGYSLTLPALPGANNTFLTVSTAGVISSAITVDASTIVLSSNQIQIPSNVNLSGKNVQAASNNVVVSNSNPATNGLAIVRGTINSGGAIGGGEGFTVINSSTGVYSVTFSPAFLAGDRPSVTATCNNSGYRTAVLSVAASNTGFTITTYDGSGTANNDSNISFIAIGQRA